MKKRILSAILCLAMVIILMPLNVNAIPNDAQDLTLDQLYYSSISYLSTTWYKITATETQYYKFDLRNQSIEARTGVGIADSFLNLFVGKMTVSVFDQYDERLTSFDVKCGYSASISLKFQEGKTYYISVYSTVDGNYTIKASKLNDIGGNTWRQAVDIEPSGNIVSAIDAAGDKDWLSFVADDVPSFYYYQLESIQSSTLYFNLYEYVEGAGDNPLRNVLDFSVSSNNKGSRDVRLKEGAKYYLCFSSTSSGTGGYVLNCIERIDGLGDEKSLAYSVDRDVEMASSFDGTTDYDWVKFKTASYDAYYHFNFSSSNKSYQNMTLYDEKGEQIAQKIMSYNNIDKLTMDKKLDPDTTYYLVFNNTDSRTSFYTFEIITKADEYPDQRENAIKVNIDTEYKSSFDGTSDYDWVKFTTANYNANYNINFSSSNKSYQNMTLYDENGEQIAQKTMSYSNIDKLSIDIKLAQNTTYYLLLNNTDSRTSTYQFIITCISDIGGETKETAYDLALNKKHELDLSSGSDVDWFKFDVLSKMNVEFYLLSESSTKLYFNLYSSRDMKLLGFDTYNSGKAVVKQIELDPGTYYLKLSGNKGYYALSVNTCLEGHTVVKDRAVSATCTKTGLTEGSHCSACGTVIKAQKIVAALGHSFDGWEITRQSTAEEDGEAKRVCTRCGHEEIVTFPKGTYFNVFSDVPSKSWYTTAALWCNANGYITGTSKSTFSPGTALTRGMFVQILARVAGVRLSDYAYSGKFSDVQTKNWYAKAVQWAVDEKITGGTSATTFSPNSPVTREQLALFFYAYSISRGFDTSKRDDLKRFADKGQISKWAVTAIKWAVAEGLISGTSETTVSPKTSATRAQAAVIFKNYVEKLMVG
ncbi:MAG: S-layer homology domain-containing protein [Clostridia bacterium]|nr:S-layer homology domain-containing protein [Clostridia bacterium]